MINKLKIGLFIAILSLFVGATHANAAALTFTDDSTVTVNSRDYTIKAGSEATSIVVGATTLTVVVPASSTFILISSSRDTLANDLSVAQVCTSSQNAVTTFGAATIVFTPTSTACTTNAGSISGGTLASVDTSNSTTSSGTSTTTVVSTNTGGSSVSSGSSSTVSNVNPVTISIDPKVTSVVLTPAYNLGDKTLKNGSTGEAVKELQRFLNAKLKLGLKIDGKLGPKTVAIVKKWQKENGLKADGLIGAKTKAFINSMSQ